MTSMSTTQNNVACVGYVNLAVGDGLPQHSYGKTMIYDYPTPFPTTTPTRSPTTSPSAPSVAPTAVPSLLTPAPTTAPSTDPTGHPSAAPSVAPSVAPSFQPSLPPSVAPTFSPTAAPSTAPTFSPSLAPSYAPTNTPSQPPTAAPTVTPSVAPSFPTATPSVAPSFRPSIAPSVAPTFSPTAAPSTAPSFSPSLAPSDAPTPYPTVDPTRSPSASTVAPTAVPSLLTPAPTTAPSKDPTGYPSAAPSVIPSVAPSLRPSLPPSVAPTFSPTAAPSTAPTFSPSLAPSYAPTNTPLQPPTAAPTVTPSVAPSFAPVQSTGAPTKSPTTSSASTTAPSSAQPNLCDDEVSKYLVTTLQLEAMNTSCNSTKIQFALLLIDLVDQIYAELSSIRLHSNISSSTRSKLSTSSNEAEVCNLTIPIVSCIEDDNDFDDDQIREMQDNVIDGINHRLAINYSVMVHLQQLQIVNTISVTVTVTQMNSTTTYPVDVSRDSASIGDISGYIVVILVLTIPLIVSVVAFAFHRKRQGSDQPAYLSLFTFFINIGDFYTDAIFTLNLYDEDNMLFPWACLFSFGPHLISVLIGFFYLTKWRQSKHKMHIADYAQRNDKLLLISIIFGGFYSTLQMATSHLFHRPQLSMPIGTWTRDTILNYKVINNVILENVPMVYIQYLYLLQTTTGASIFDNGLNITLLAMAFSITAILFGVLTISLRALNGCMDCMRTADLKTIPVAFELKARDTSTIKPYHLHTHSKLSEALCIALNAFHVQLSQVEVAYIQKLSDGIRVKARVRYLTEAQALRVKKQVDDPHSEFIASLRTECIRLLQLDVASADDVQVVALAKKDKEELDSAGAKTQQQTETAIELQAHSDEVQ